MMVPSTRPVKSAFSSNTSASVTVASAKAIKLSPCANHIQWRITGHNRIKKMEPIHIDLPITLGDF